MITYPPLPGLEADLTESGVTVGGGRGDNFSVLSTTASLPVTNSIDDLCPGRA